MCDFFLFCNLYAAHFPPQSVKLVSPLFWNTTRSPIIAVIVYVNHSRKHMCIAV